MQVPRSSLFTLLTAGFTGLGALPVVGASLTFTVHDVSPTAFMSTHPGVGVHAAALNNRGQVLEQTVLSRRPGGGAPLIDSFLYTNGAVVDLGAARAGTSLVWGTGLNDNGEVAGTCAVTGFPLSTAFTYSHGKLTPLPPSAEVPSFVVLNIQGTLAATVSGPLAARYSAGSWVPLGGPAGIEQSVAAINDSGEVAGASGPDAAVWSNGKLTDLGDFPGQFDSFAVGIANNGDVAGMSFGSLTIAFVWNKRHGLTPLPVPPGLMLEANAVAGIDDQGVVAGNAYGPDGLHLIGWYGGEAFDVTQDVVNKTGLSIQQVTGINNLLEVSADAVDSSGVVHPVILTPSFGR